MSIKNFDYMKNMVTELTNSEYTLCEDNRDIYKNTLTKVHFQHNTCGHIFVSCIDRFRTKIQNNKIPCTACMRKKEDLRFEQVRALRYNYDWAKKTLFEKTNNAYILCDENDRDIYENKFTPNIHFEHSECGTKFQASLEEVLRSYKAGYHFCPQCKALALYNIQVGTPNIKRFSYDWVCQEIKTITSGEYEVVENDEDRKNYNGKLTPIHFIHNKCGRTFQSRPKDLRYLFTHRGSGCPLCGRENSNKNRNNTIYKKTIEGTNIRERFSSFTEFWNKYHDDEYDVLSDPSEFKSLQTKMKFKHKVCGHEFLVALSCFKNGSRCPKCANEKRATHLTPKRDISVFREKFKLWDSNNEYDLISTEYINNKTKLQFRHKKCGTVFEMRPNDFQQGYRCPECAKLKSGPEIDIKNFIAEHYCGEILTNYRNLIPLLEIDVYIPEKNVAIEFDGLYWHQERRVGKKYHYDKTKKCLDKGVRLLHIFEDEWRDQQDIVKSKILNILGISNTEKIFARKCECVDLTKNKDRVKEIRDFLDKNHIQGYCTSTYQIGLLYNNKLVAIGCFNNLRSSMNKSGNNNSYDMIRYASGIDLNVVGGCGKIIEFFRKKYNCNFLKTLADLRWCSSTTNLYTHLGFKIENYVEPRYFYVNKDEQNLVRLPRFTFRKERIKTKFPNIYDEKLTEFQIMDRTNYFRVWDAGKITYSKTFD